jgi:hypothetical protein
MTKAHLRVLERVFTAEIECRLPCQMKESLNVLAMEQAGMIQREVMTVTGMPVTVSGWVLTHAGRITYCESCK